MDFDSTITAESTLLQLYLRLPKPAFEETIKISNLDYYRYEEQLVASCYSKLKSVINKSDTWEGCLNSITAEVINYSEDIGELELCGMALIEECLKCLDIKSLRRASSQINIRKGFSSFVNKFSKKERYILSFNWSSQLIRLVCPNIPSNNIISNKLKFNRKKCIGFDRNLIFLTPQHKLVYFNRLKDKINVFCGDSLPDLLPCLYSNIAFAFKSHDKEFLSIFNILRKKFSRHLYMVDNFKEAGKILDKLQLIF